MPANESKLAIHQAEEFQLHSADWFHYLKAQGQSGPQDSFGSSPTRSERLFLNESACAGCCEATAAHWALLKQQPRSDVPCPAGLQMLTCSKVLGTEWDKPPRHTSSLSHCDRESRCDGILYLQGQFAILSHSVMMRRNQWVHFQQQNWPIFIPFWCFQASFFPLHRTTSLCATHVTKQRYKQSTGLE